MISRICAVFKLFLQLCMICIKNVSENYFVIYFWMAKHLIDYNEKLKFFCVGFSL